MRTGGGEDPAVEDPGGEHPHAVLDAGVEHDLGPAAVEQRAAAGEQDAVDVHAADEPGGDLGVVRAQAHGADHAFVSEAEQGGEGLGLGLVEVVVGVVDVEQVDPIQAEPFDAVGDRPMDAVGAEVERRDDRWDRFEDRVVGWPAGYEEPSDLGRQQVLVPWARGQRRSEPRFREPVAVERCGVEEADAPLPCCVDRRSREVVVDGPIEVAERRAPEGQAADVGELHRWMPVNPPSIRWLVPVTKAASSDARYAIRAAISSGVAILPMGWVAANVPSISASRPG